MLLVFNVFLMFIYYKLPYDGRVNFTEKDGSKCEVDYAKESRQEIVKMATRSLNHCMASPCITLGKGIDWKGIIDGLPLGDAIRKRHHTWNVFLLYDSLEHSAHDRFASVGNNNLGMYISPCIYHCGPKLKKADA